MKTTKPVALLAMLGAVALGACADESPTAPSSLLEEALNMNAAIVAADATLEDITLARSAFAFGGRMGGGFGMGAGPSGRPGGQMGVGGSLSGTRTATFYDANGVEQAAYDSLTTASVHYTLEIAGDVNRGIWTGSVSRSRDMTVTGLLGSETTRTHNGFGSETVSRSATLDDGVQATFDMEGTFTQSDLMVPIPGAEPRYPLSGTITRTMKVAVVNGETYEIDLDARPNERPVRKRNCGTCTGG